MALPVFDVGRILGWIKTAGADVAKFIALRMLLISLISVLLPWAIYTAWMIIQEKVIEFGVSRAGTDGFWSGQMVELTGLGAWLADKLQFIQCFNMLAIAATFAFVMGFIKR